MTKGISCKLLFWTCMGMGAVYVVVTEPVGRLPQAAPSLSRQAAEPVPRLGPDGLQSTIAVPVR